MQPVPRDVILLLRADGEFLEMGLEVFFFQLRSTVSKGQLPGCWHVWLCGKDQIEPIRTWNRDHTCMMHDSPKMQWNDVKNWRWTNKTEQKKRKEKENHPKKNYNRKEPEKMWGFKGLFAYLWEVYDTTQMNCTKQLIAINCGPKENVFVSSNVYPENRICNYDSVTQEIIFTSENRSLRRLIDVFRTISLKGFSLYRSTHQSSRVPIFLNLIYSHNSHFLQIEVY